MKRAVVAIFTLAYAVAGTTAEAHRYRSCKEVSSVVGYQRWARFAGRWGLPRWVPSLSLDLGVVGHRFTAEGIDAHGSVTHYGVPYRYRVTGVPTDDRAFTARALAMRMTATFHGRFYAGAEEELGGLGQAPRLATEAAPTTSALPAMSSSGGMYIAARAVLGVQAGVERVTMAGELATGMRMIVFDTHSRLMGDSQINSVLQVRSVVEARVRASYWLSPWLALGVSFGTSLVERGDVAIGVDISGHSRTFGGRH